MTEQMTKLKDLISRTFQIVADIRYKEGIETVDNAYDVFLRNGIEDFQPFAFQLQTCAAKNLNPERIKEYLEIIHREQGFSACQAAADYVVTVMAKYLQMMAVYSIYKEEPDRVTEHFQRFNKDFGQLCEAFKEVTHQAYKPGHEVKTTKPLAPKPKQQQQQEQQQTLSNQEQVKQTSSRDPLRERIGADGKVAFLSDDKSP